MEAGATAFTHPTAGVKRRRKRHGRGSGRRRGEVGGGGPASPMTTDMGGTDSASGAAAAPVASSLSMPLLGGRSKQQKGGEPPPMVSVATSSGKKKKKNKKKRKRDRRGIEENSGGSSQFAPSSAEVEGKDPPGGGANDDTYPSRRKRSRRDGARPSRRPGPPSAEALRLSSELRDLSSRKRLSEALRLYRSPVNDLVRDGHHGAIVVDCCSRCGDVEGGEKVVEEMQSSGLHVSVQAKTALLKGYAHSGRMDRGAALFREMCDSKEKRDRPNVRTLNTLLRGCLWTAATATATATASRGSAAVRLSGGVVTSEEAWRLFSQRCGGGGCSAPFDASSYEYSAALLCQSLRVDEAEVRIEEMRRALGVKLDNDDDYGDGGGEVGVRGSPDALESVAAALLGLARAYALLGTRDEAGERAASVVKCIDAAKEVVSADDLGEAVQNSKMETSGGKRSWKKSAEPSTTGEESRRSSSNVLFRSHRLSEMRGDALTILELLSEKKGRTLIELSDEQWRHRLARYLATRLLYFSGGGTTDLSATRRLGNAERERNCNKSSCNVTEQLLTSSWWSFGLCAAIGKPVAKDPEPNACLTKKDLNALRSARLDPSRLGLFSSDGRLDFSRIFSDPNSLPSCEESSSQGKKPVHIELGAGSGDWIRTQALAQPADNFVSVELRSDRVAQTFAKCMLVRSGEDFTNNICCIGAECGSFLQLQVPEKSVTTIYVNHPEPPTQTYGSSEDDILAVQGDAEPAHMLNSKTLLAAAHCLRPNGEGRLIIVTDNRWYATLIISTLEKVVAQNEKLLTQIDLDEKRGYRRVDHFASRSPSISRLSLFEGKPSEAIGHSTLKNNGNSGASYFDRLWRTGAGSHAEMKRRFVIAVRTFNSSQDKQQYCTCTRNSGQGGRAGSGTGKRSVVKKSNRKRSAEKQQRRNERRLAKRRSAQELIRA